MKTNIWLWKDLYLDNSVCDWVKQNCEGLFLSCNEMTPFYTENQSLFPNTMLITDEWLDEWLKKFPNIKRFYNDEPLTMCHEIYYPKQGKLTVGDIPKSFFKDNANKFFYYTYTSYQEFWFRIFRLNIYKFWKNQIGSWEYLQKNYPDKFSFVWIHLLLNKNDYRELIRWAKDHNKEIWLYAGDNNITKDDLINYGNKFITELNR